MEIALPGTARLTPPDFLRRCPLFFFRTPTILHFRIAFWPLEPWTRGDKRACVNSKHNSRRRSPCSESATRERCPALSPSAHRERDNDARRSLAWPPAWRGIVTPAQPENIVTNESAAARLSGVLLYVLLHCCTAVLLYWVGPWVDGGWWAGGGWRLALSLRCPSIVKK